MDIAPTRFQSNVAQKVLDVGSVTTNFVGRNIITIIYFLFSLLIVSFVIFVIIRSKNKSLRGVVLISEPIEPKDEPTICERQIITSDTNEYTYSFWCYVKNWTPRLSEDTIPFASDYLIFNRRYQEHIMIVTISNDKPDLCIYIFSDAALRKELEDFDENLSKEERQVRIQEFFKNKKYVLEDFRLQSWNHIVISQWKQTMDLYINGKLARTFVLKHDLSPHVPENLKIGGQNGTSYDGYLSRFIYYPRVLTPHEIYSLYRRGPSRRSNIFSFGKLAKVDMALNANKPSQNLSRMVTDIVDDKHDRIFY